MIPVAGKCLRFFFPTYQPLHSSLAIYLSQPLPVACLLDAFLLQALNPRKFSLHSLRMCGDSHVQACVLLRPVANVFECFLGVEQAEHKQKQ